MLPTGINIYAHILDSMDNGVVVLDFEGRILIFNPAAERVLGLPAQTAEGRYYRDIFFDTDSNDGFNDVLIEIIVSRSQLTRIETEYTRSTGKKVPIAITGTLLLDEAATAYGVLLVITDLTETRQQRFIREAFGRYVAQPVADLVERHPDSIVLEPEEREASILFADIRGFTRLSEHLSPGDLLALLSQYLGVMAAATIQYGGTVDKFMGDAIMGLFNAPTPLLNHAEMAVRTGLEIQQRVKALNRVTGHAIQVDVGICTGRVVVGNLGSEQRLEYTAIGDTVNIASRLEGLNKHHDSQLIISQSTYAEVASLVYAKELGPVKVTGKTRTVRIYAVYGARS